MENITLQFISHLNGRDSFGQRAFRCAVLTRVYKFAMTYLNIYYKVSYILNYTYEQFVHVYGLHWGYHYLEIAHRLQNQVVNNSNAVKQQSMLPTIPRQSAISTHLAACFVCNRVRLTFNRIFGCVWNVHKVQAMCLQFTNFKCNRAKAHLSLGHGEMAFGMRDFRFHRGMHQVGSNKVEGLTSCSTSDMCTKRSVTSINRWA